MVVFVEWLGLCVALPAILTVVTLVVMVEVFYHGLLVSLLVSVLVGWFGCKEGARLSRNTPIDKTIGRVAGLLGKTALAYVLAVLAAVVADWVCWRFQVLATWLASPLAAAGVYVGAQAVLTGDLRKWSFHFRRGRQLITYAAAVKRAARLRPSSDQGLVWGGLRLPSGMGVSHFCVSGAPGSGKSVTLRLLMQSVLPDIGRRPDRRALVYDAKQDMISLLYGMNLSCEIRILNPFDARSWAWDMGKDVTSPATAQQVASILVSPEEGANRFFSDAAQHLLAGAMISLVRAGRPWTLRDVLLATGDKEALRATLERDAHTRLLIAKYFQDERLLSNILSTLAAKTMLYEPVAAVWDQAVKAGRVLSLAEWANGDFILVLGNDETIRGPMDAVNRVLFRRLSELLLAGTESSTRRSWVFLDEVAKAGKLDGLDSLLTKGRSKGVCVVLGFQDIDSLRDPLLYGEKGANALVAECANKSFLRLDSEPTARWASGLIGEAEAYEYHRSDTTGGPSGGTESISEQLVKREAVLASELMGLPPPDAVGLHGYHLIPSIGAYLAHYEFVPLLTRPGDEPDFVPRPIEEQYLTPWSQAECERLGLAFPVGGASEHRLARVRKPCVLPLRDVQRVTRAERGA